tara:strand:- start:2511 stop:3485 length:975 start_codon:yes stop_codon:yes gene_type:complete
MSESDAKAQQEPKKAGRKPKVKKEGEEKEVKPKQKKTLPLTHEEYNQCVDETILPWNKLVTNFTGAQSAHINKPDNAPTKDEYAAVPKLLTDSKKHYKALAACKRGKKEGADDKVKKTGAKKETGFNKPSFFPARIATIFNTKFDLPSELHFKFYPEVGGDSIGTSASAGQLCNDYINRHNLKSKKSGIVCDAVLEEIFTPFLDQVVEGTWKRNDDGKLQFPHKTLQSLTPKMFDSHIRVPVSMITDDEKNRLNARSVILKERTSANNALKSKAEKAAKTAADVEKAKAAAAKAAQEAADEKIAMDKANSAANQRAALLMTGGK